MSFLNQPFPLWIRFFGKFENEGANKGEKKKVREMNMRKRET